MHQDEMYASFLELQTEAPNQRLAVRFRLGDILNTDGEIGLKSAGELLRIGKVQAAVGELGGLLEAVLKEFCVRAGHPPRQSQIGQLSHEVVEIAKSGGSDHAAELESLLTEAGKIRNRRSHHKSPSPSAQADANTLLKYIFDVLAHLAADEDRSQESSDAAPTFDGAPPAHPSATVRSGSDSGRGPRHADSATLPAWELAKAVEVDAVWDACAVEGVPSVLIGSERDVLLVPLSTRGATVRIATLPEQVRAVETSDDESVLAVQAGEWLFISEGGSWSQPWPAPYALEPGERLLGIRLNGRSLTLVAGSNEGHRRFSIDAGGTMFNVEREADPATNAALSGEQFVIVGDGEVRRGNLPGFLTYEIDRIVAVGTATALWTGGDGAHFAAVVERDEVMYLRWIDDQHQLVCPIERDTTGVRVVAGPSMLGVVTRVGGTMIYRALEQLSEAALDAA